MTSELVSVKLETSTDIGTAFRIGAGLYLTAAHCLVDIEENCARTEEATLHLTNGPETAFMVWHDCVLDAALLKCRYGFDLDATQPLLGRFPEARSYSDIHWKSAGFATGDGEGRRLSLSGVVEGLDPHPVARLQLTCDQHGADSNPLGGSSGSPIWVKGRIVALLNRMPSAFKERVLYATPVATIIEHILTDAECRVLLDTILIEEIKLDEIDFALGKMLTRIGHEAEASSEDGILTHRFTTGWLARTGLGKTFVEPRLARIDDGIGYLMGKCSSSVTPETSKPLKVWTNEMNTNGTSLKMLVLGEAGTGKTTFLNNIVLNAFSNPSSVGLHRPHVPFVVPLREISVAQRANSFPEWIASANDKCVLPTRGITAFSNLGLCEAAFRDIPLRSGAPWLMLLDGFDEVPFDRLPDVQRTIRGCLRHSTASCILTSRSGTYNLSVASLIRECSFDTYSLCQWGEPQTREFAQHLIDNPNEFLSQYFEVMCGDSTFTPLLVLLAICVFMDTGQVPSTRLDLYDVYIENAVLRALRRSGDNTPGWISREGSSIVHLMSPLALQSAKHPRAFQFDDMCDLLIETIKVEYGVATTPARVQSAEFLRHIAIGSGILQEDQGKVRWCHVSIRDYLAGCGLATSMVLDTSEFESLWSNDQFSDVCVFALIRASIMHSDDPAKFQNFTFILQSYTNYHFSSRIYFALAEGAQFGEEVSRQIIERLVNGAINMGSIDHCKDFDSELGTQGRSPVDMLLKLRKHASALAGLQRIAEADGVRPWMRDRAREALAKAMTVVWDRC